MVFPKNDHPKQPLIKITLGYLSDVELFLSEIFTLTN